MLDVYARALNGDLIPRAATPDFTSSVRTREVKPAAITVRFNVF
jgi:hypothetical protein